MLEKTKATQYSPKNPFMSVLKERVRLNLPGSKKETYHLVLDLRGSGLAYEVGDCVGILVYNDDETIQKILGYLKLPSDSIVQNGEASNTLRELLSQHKDLAMVPKALVGWLAERQSDADKRKKLQGFLEAPGGLDQLNQTYQIWDFLAEFAVPGLEAGEFSEMLFSLDPRLYSIASAPEVVGEEIHLTVRLLTYETNSIERWGVCTRLLCKTASEGSDVLPIYIHPHRNLDLPEDPAANIIMIGPGTGIAPFRAFMQERERTGATGENLLFFGEWTREHDFFYEDEWKQFEDKGLLDIETAFSRDQDYKIYVQDKLWERREQIWDWLKNGAYLYVCGDAEYMAKDVHKALVRMAEEVGGMERKVAKRYLRQLIQEKRYQRDIY